MMPQTVEIDRNRFSFLKLHGSVSLYRFENGDGCEHIHSIPDLQSSPVISDETFFVPPGHGRHSNQPKPALIVFPHEKDYLQGSPNNRFSFRTYIPVVWEAARQFAAEAEEIWIIGYSCPEPDFPAIEGLLNNVARACRKIVIKNPCAEEMCNSLRHRLDADFTIQIGRPEQAVLRAVRVPVRERNVKRVDGDFP